MRTFRNDPDEPFSLVLDRANRAKEETLEAARRLLADPPEPGAWPWYGYCPKPHRLQCITDGCGFPIDAVAEDPPCGHEPPPDDICPQCGEPLADYETFLREGLHPAPSSPRRWYLTFTGAAMDIPGNTAAEAIASIRHNMDCYSAITAREIGVDVDELGWPLVKGQSA